MIGILLILLKILLFFYLFIALSIFLWSLLPTTKELPEEDRVSWSEALMAAILWPLTIWICLTTFAKSIDEEDI